MSWPGIRRWPRETSRPPCPWGSCTRSRNASYRSARGSWAGETALQLAEDSLEVLTRPGGRHGVVERLRFLVEGELRAREHRDARAQRRQLPRQVAVAQDDQLVAGGRRIRCKLRLERLCIGVDVAKGALVARRLPIGRAVVGIHVVGVVLAHGQHQPDVVLRERVHFRCLRCTLDGSIAGRSPARKNHCQQARRQHQSGQSKSHRA